MLTFTSSTREVRLQHPLSLRKRIAASLAHVVEALRCGTRSASGFAGVMKADGLWRAALPKQCVVRLSRQPEQRQRGAATPWWRGRGTSHCAL